MKPVTMSLSVALMCASLASAASNPDGVFHFFQYPGNYDTSLQGVSNNNIGAGYYVDASNLAHGFIVRNGVFRQIDYSNVSTYVYGVNSSGTAVGWYRTATGAQFAFSYSNGTYMQVGPAGCINSAAFGINDLGEIAGACETETGLAGWIFDGTSYQTVMVPGSYLSQVTGINMSGLATVIWQYPNGDFQSSFYNGTSFTTIDVPGGGQTYAWGLNNAGDVAFDWNNEVTNYGAVLVNGTYKTFEAPHCVSTIANGINDHHVIVGTCFKQRGGDFGFYATY
jgi:probable HAF family extracellular repeat protein